MDRCPACDHELPPGSTECPRCGVVLARYRARPPAPPAEPPPAGLPPARTARGPGRLLAVIGVGLALGVLAVGAWWALRVRPRLDRIDGIRRNPGPSRPTKVRAIVDAVAEFDRSIPLPVDPLGAAARETELVVGNRREPGGLLRVRSLGGEEFELQAVPVSEPGFGQLVSFNAVAWDGDRWVALTDGAWFQRRGADVFAFLDADRLALVRHQPAPSYLGGLAWDGTGWWASTRKNTETAPEEAWLYRFDASFREVARFRPPGVGCQGLAWDGTRLWFADVFSDHVEVLDVSGEAPRVVTSRPTPFAYLSGIASFGGEIWVTEYGAKALHRLNPRVRTAWAGGFPRHGEDRDEAVVLERDDGSTEVEE